MTLDQVAADFGTHPVTLSKWMRQADVDGASGERQWLTGHTIRSAEIGAAAQHTEIGTM